MILTPRSPCLQGLERSEGLNFHERARLIDPFAWVTGASGQRSILEVGHRNSTGLSSGAGRQPLDREPVAVSIQVGAHLVASMSAEPIPQQHHLLTCVQPLRWSSTPIRLSVS